MKETPSRSRGNSERRSRTSSRSLAKVFSKRQSAVGSSAGGSSGSRLPAATAEEKSLRFLIIFGWITALLYFPSGLLHGALGPVVYLRDIMLGFHLMASTVWLSERSQIKWVAMHSWIILVTPILLIPAVLDGTYTMEALRTCKWSLCWLDWILLGHMLYLNKTWGEWFRILLVISAALMTAECAAGALEWHRGSYLIPTAWNETTAFGVRRASDQILDGKIRIHGLQRDVFSFANIMGMNAVAGMAVFVVSTKLWQRLLAVAWTAGFGWMMVVSGGRSALFGAFAAAAYAVFCLIFPNISKKYARSYVLAWVFIAVAMSFIGVGKFTDFVGGQFMGGTHIGDAESAYERDAFWVQMLGDFAKQPLILVSGGPFGSLIDNRIATMFHWADNQLLWNTYHLGVAGSLAILFFFYKVLEPEPGESDQRARRALILFLVFVLGEGIARESMTFIGCLPLFLFCGYDSAAEMNRRRLAIMAASPLRRVRQSSGGAR